MKPYTPQQIVRITGGSFHGDAALLARPMPHISIDSRTVGPDGLYVPVHGQVHDGHAFIESAFQNGALLTLSERAVPFPHILVDSTLAALQQIAKDCRGRFSCPVIGITGSVGKTTTKELVYAVAQSQYRAYRTPGNLNNQTGVPQAIFGIPEDCEAAVLEMGTNRFGEIERLSCMAEPTCCLFTNIGEAHIEFFGDREGIFRGKTEMLVHKRPGAAVIVNGDDDLLRKVPGAIRYGLDPAFDVYADGIREDGLNGVYFNLHFDGLSLPVFVAEPGRHMVSNALAAAAVGRAVGVTPENILRGIAAYEPPAGRMNVEHLARITLLNDCYNANPTSAEASLKVLGKAAGRRVFVFGDMLELGDAAPALHARVGAFARSVGVDLLVAVGPLARHAAEGGGAVWFPTVDALLTALPELIRDGDTVLLKASRGMHFERAAEALRTR